MNGVDEVQGILKPAIVEYGPYGKEKWGPGEERWAWRIANIWLSGWTVADTEEECLSDAKKEGQAMGPFYGVTVKGWELRKLDEVPLYLPRTGDVGSMGGVYEAEGVRVPFGGGCPVQGDGIVDGYPCYYRARGSTWRLTVDVTEDTSWNYHASLYCAWPLAGWLHREESCKNIEKAVAAFREREQQQG